MKVLAKSVVLFLFFQVGFSLAAPTRASIWSCAKAIASLTYRIPARLIYGRKINAERFEAERALLSQKPPKEIAEAVTKRWARLETKLAGLWLLVDDLKPVIEKAVLEQRRVNLGIFGDLNLLGANLGWHSWRRRLTAATAGSIVKTNRGYLDRSLGWISPIRVASRAIDKGVAKRKARIELEILDDVPYSRRRHDLNRALPRQKIWSGAWALIWWTLGYTTIIDTGLIAIGSYYRAEVEATELRTQYFQARAEADMEERLAEEGEEAVANLKELLGTRPQQKPPKAQPEDLEPQDE